ncbi:fic family toxin-antitoxin system, toxin component [Streptomyces sp. bgisy100]|uniref:fic family toxin-antitoxin system, toxin component n=1 Tax=Streptomyces sp. bgisy100 TaxID=3413783 RepID=UPI003D759681
MIHDLDLGNLLQLAERIPGDPQVDDYGALVCAAKRPSAAVGDIECYQTLTGKAASLLHSLALLQPLEHSNNRFALIAALSWLEANGVRMKPDPKQAEAVLSAVRPGMAGVRAVARGLREWADG